MPNERVEVTNTTGACNIGKHYQIQRITDEHECDTCGYTFADGYIVTRKEDSSVVAVLEPIALCYDGTDYTEEDAYKAILLDLGAKVDVI